MEDRIGRGNTILFPNKLEEEHTRLQDNPRMLAQEKQDILKPLPYFGKQKILWDAPLVTIPMAFLWWKNIF